MMRHGVPTPPALCYMENVRCEVRLYDGTGAIAGTLPAEFGTHQQNLILQGVR